MTSALADIRAARGLDAYLDVLEARLERAVEAHPGVVAAVGKESLAAGGKRLRPVLVFLSAPENGDSSTVTSAPATTPVSRSHAGPTVNAQPPSPGWSVPRTGRPSTVPPTGCSAFAPHASSGSNGTAMTPRPRGPGATWALNRCWLMEPSWHRGAT